MSAIGLAAEVLRSFRDPVPVPDGLDIPLTPAPEAIGRAIILPEPIDTPDVDPALILRRRRAIRFYGDRPFPLATLHSAIEAGLAADRRRWPEESVCCPLVPVVVAQNVDGLPPAIYRLDGSPARTASPVMALDGRESYEELTLQREFATAGAIVSLLGDLDRAERTHGGSGYRALMARAGAAAYQMWLAAIAHDAVGSVFAGFLPAAIRLPLRCDGVNRHQLFALALGHPGADLPNPVGD